MRSLNAVFYAAECCAAAFRKKARAEARAFEFFVAADVSRLILV